MIINKWSYNPSLFLPFAFKQHLPITYFPLMLFLSAATKLVLKNVYHRLKVITERKEIRCLKTKSMAHASRMINMKRFIKLWEGLIFQTIFWFLTMYTNRESILASDYAIVCCNTLASVTSGRYISERFTNKNVNVTIEN